MVGYREKMHFLSLGIRISHTLGIARGRSRDIRSRGRSRSPFFDVEVKKFDVEVDSWKFMLTL